MASLHVLMIPFPGQGHVIPLMEISQCLAELGFHVTFVNTEFDHRRVLNVLTGTTDGHLLGGRIRLVSIPDGLEPGEDRNDLDRLCEGIMRVMPRKLEQLIGELNEGEEHGKVASVIADLNMSWALEVAQKMGIRRAAFWPASAALLASLLSFPKMIEDGIIDENGTPLKQEMIRLGPNMPEMNPAHLFWTCMGDLAAQTIVFDYLKTCVKFAEDVEWVLCNSSIDLESGAFEYAPRILPLGPLLASNRLGSTVGYFWPPEDSECLDWLNHQLPHSVIYVAFGSITVFDPSQVEELALGLEMTGMPFLWVIRPDNKHSGKMPVSRNGKIVGWAPQQKVLEHPSIACFVSHCGWNSIMEGVSNGLPFLCWPYFSDQFSNESYICDVWKVGLRLEHDESGIITRDQIKSKVDALLGDDGFGQRALEIKDKVIDGVKEGGESYNNFTTFVDSLKNSKRLIQISTSVNSDLVSSSSSFS